MSKHTPGPWTMHEINPNDPEWGACGIMATDDEFVATMVLGVKNAHLIAAAPELLAACEASLEVFELSGLPHYSGIIDKLIEAITKAGGQP